MTWCQVEIIALGYAFTAYPRLDGGLYYKVLLIGTIKDVAWELPIFYAH